MAEAAAAGKIACPAKIRTRLSHRQEPMSKTFTAALAASVVTLLTFTPAGAAALLTGTASYTLELTGAAGFGAIGDLNGRLNASLTSSTCGVYESTADMEMEIVPAAGPSTVNVTTARWTEAPDSMEFLVESAMDGIVMERSSGTATRTATGLSVVLTEPEARTVELTGDLVFPLEMVSEAIAAAEDGQRLTTLTVYDGSGDGTSFYSVSVLIGEAGGALAPGIEADLAQTLGMDGMPHWPMTFSYFLPGSAGDASPAFTTEAIVYDNGYVLESNYDFGLFSAGLSLVSFEPSASPTCPD